jgi:hypothetical protein
MRERPRKTTEWHRPCCIPVFRLARIREAVRQHSLIYVFGESAQNAKRDAMLASREGFANSATWKLFAFRGMH